MFSKETLLLLAKYLKAILCIFMTIKCPNISKNTLQNRPTLFIKVVKYSNSLGRKIARKSPVKKNKIKPLLLYFYSYVSRMCCIRLIFSWKTNQFSFDIEIQANMRMMS